MKIVVLDGFAVNPGDLSWDFLRGLGELAVYDKTPPELRTQRCDGAEAVFTNRVVIDGALLDACPSIHYVSALGTGYDMIDVAACTKRGVAVCNVPAYSTASVAQLTVTLMLALVTDLDGLRGIVRDGNWTGVPGFEYQRVRYGELAGRTLGLIGCGGIGGRVAAITSALGMNVVATTRSRASGTDGCVRYMTRDALLAEADVLSLHCPLTPETRGMVDAAFIGRMKRGALLVNTARGAILNEADVAAALRSGALGGAALDVLEREPPAPDCPLLGAPNCIITPHVAWTTTAARGRLLAVLEASLRDFRGGGAGLNRVN